MAFDLAKSTNVIDQSLADTQSAREQLLTTSSNTVQQVQQVDKTLLKNLDMLNRQAEGEYEVIDTASKRLESMAQNPDVVNKVLGFFDPDFNKEAQLERLRRSQINLNTIATKGANVTRARDITVNDINLTQTSVENFYQITRQGLLDNSTAAQLGIALKNQAKDDRFQQVMDADTKTLNMWKRRPETVPPELQDRGGLVELELVRRTAQRLNVDITSVNLQAISQDNRNKDYVSQFGSLPELKTAFQKGELPSDVQPGFVRDEITRLEDIEASFAAAQALAKQRNFDLAEKYKKDAMARMSSSDWRELDDAIKASGNREIRVGDIPLTRAEITTGLATSLQREDGEKKILYQGQLAAQNVESLSTQFSGLVNGYTGLLGNGDTATLEDVPPNVKAVIQQGISNQAFYRSLGENDPEIANMQAADLQARVEFMNKQIDETIKNQYKKEEQPGARQFADNGRFVTQSASAEYLAANASNTELFASNPILAEPGRLLSRRLAETGTDATIQSFKTNADGGLEVTKGDSEIASILENAVQTSGARESFSNTATQFVVTKALDVLIANDPDPATSVFRQFYNPQTKRLSDEFYDYPVDANGNQKRVFKFEKMRKKFATLSVDMADKGTLPPDTNLGQVIFDRANQLIDNGAIREIFDGNINNAALNMALFNNRPDVFVKGQLAAQENQMPLAVQNARQLKEELQTLITPAAEGGRGTIKSPGNVLPGTPIGLTPEQAQNRVSR